MNYFECAYVAFQIPDKGTSNKTDGYQLNLGKKAELNKVMVKEVAGSLNMFKTKLMICMHGRLQK